MHEGLKKTCLYLPVPGVTLTRQSTPLLTLAKWGPLEKRLVERCPLLHEGLKKTCLYLPVPGVTLPRQSTPLLTLAEWGRAGKAFC